MATFIAALAALAAIAAIVAVYRGFALALDQKAEADEQALEALPTQEQPLWPNRESGWSEQFASGYSITNYGDGSGRHFYFNPFKVAVLEPTEERILAKLREEGHEIAFAESNGYVISETLDVLGCLVYAAHEMDDPSWLAFSAKLRTHIRMRAANHEARGIPQRNADLVRMVELLSYMRVDWRGASVRPHRFVPRPTKEGGAL